MCLPTVKTSLMNLAEKSHETSWIAWWNSPWKWKYNQRMNSVKKITAKKIHIDIMQSYRNYHVITFLEFHWPSTKIYLYITLHYLHLSHLCFGAPRWYTQTICHAWATYPQQAITRSSAAQYCDTPKNATPPPQKKKRNQRGGVIIGIPRLYIYVLYVCIHIYYLLGSFNSNWKEYARQIGSSRHGKNAKNVVNHHQGRRSVHWFPSFRFRCPEVHEHAFLSIW